MISVILWMCVIKSKEVQTGLFNGKMNRIVKV